MKSDKLAAMLLADRDRDKPDHNIIPCFSCSHTFVYRGRQGDLNGRFCSMRCQAWFDDGNAPIARSDPFAVPLGDWKVVAGPPGVEIGSSYYGGVFGDRPLTPKHALILTVPTLANQPMGAASISIGVPA